MNRQQQRPRGKRGLAGSILNPPSTDAGQAQQPSIPVEQLRPNHAQLLVASERLGLKKKPMPDAKVRVRVGLTRQDIAKLLRKYPNIAKNVSDDDCAAAYLAEHPNTAEMKLRPADRARLFRTEHIMQVGVLRESDYTMVIQLGDRNITETQAAARQKYDRIAFGVYLESLDREICEWLLARRLVKARKGKFINNTVLDLYEWDEQHDSDLQDAAIAKGDGDMYIAPPKRRPGKHGEHFKARDSFNTGTLRRTKESDTELALNALGDEWDKDE